MNQKILSCLKVANDLFHLKLTAFTFYGDISAEIFYEYTRRLCAKVEVYSIDEAFLESLDELEKNYDLYDFGCHIRRLIKQWTGVPVRIGIALRPKP